jgi:PadR family transcriptional regulator AphA
MTMNVRTLCLGFLSTGEASGYEIKKGIEDGMFSHFIDASFGSIYPALTQLTAEGLLVLPAKDKFKSEFLFQMLLHQFITPDVMLAAIDKQLNDLRQDLARIAECRCSEQPHAGARFVADYGEAVLTASVRCLEEKRRELVRQTAAQAAE